MMAGRRTPRRGISAGRGMDARPGARAASKEKEKNSLAFAKLFPDKITVPDPPVPRRLLPSLHHSIEKWLRRSARRGERGRQSVWQAPPFDYSGCFGIVSQLFGCPVGMVAWPRVPCTCPTRLVLLDSFTVRITARSGYYH
jgi:hypothetical protein